MSDYPTMSILSEVTITATYENEANNFRVIQKSIQLPLKLFLRSCQSENAASFALTLKSAEPVHNFSQIFPGKVMLKF